MLGAVLGIAIVAVLIMVAAASLSVVRQLLRLKRRAGDMANNQLFVALTAAQSDFKSLDTSVAALGAQAAALKSATGRVRDSIRDLAQIREIIGLDAFKSQLRDLLSVLR